MFWSSEEKSTSSFLFSSDTLLLQAARELVLEVIREKDGEFRSSRTDFSSRLGGSNLDVR